MKKKHYRASITPFVTGVAVGIGLIMLREARGRRDPDHSPSQRRINRALDAALHHARRLKKLKLNMTDRYVVFSDHHKGARNSADDFVQCERTYLQALDYYHDQNFSLVILGDAEELWEEEPTKVLAAYANVLENEARFHPDRYFRIYGNHDDAWEHEELVEHHLWPFFPNLRYHGGLAMEVIDRTGIHGEILMVHGHQGTLGSDTFAFMGPRVLPFYRSLQIMTGLGRTTPANDACLRAEHDTQMYRWAGTQDKLILIAGHTHRPVWSSVTHLEKLLWRVHQLQERYRLTIESAIVEQVADVREQIRRLQENYPPCNDTIKTRPCYFNTGCCRFADGDITGIELDEHRIRLIKWGEIDGAIARTVLEETHLMEVLALL